MAHKHAKLMMEYAKDWAETYAPWTRYEMKLDTGEWVGFPDHPGWHPDVEYRRKPRTININGIDVPEPVREALNFGADYFTPSLSAGEAFYSASWCCSFSDNLRLERGLVHLTEEAAIQHAKALLSFTKEDK